MEFFDYKNYRAISRVYFPEPKTPITKFPRFVSDIEIYQNSNDPLAVLGRLRLNSWLRDWKYPDKKDLLARLNSKSAADHDGAVWELYLNSLFRYLGFHVERDPLKASGKTPDFLITRLGRRYYVEATSVSRGPSSPTQKHWESLVNKVDAIQREDYSITFHPSKTSNKAPRAKQIIKQITAFLDAIDYEQLCRSGIWNRPETLVKDNDWEIRVSPLAKKPIGRSEYFIALCGNADSGLISDLEDLRTKISKKRKRYGRLDAPFIIAILENSFAASNDRWHRFGALFGNEALRLSPNGTTKSIRIENGIWSDRKKESYVEGLMLVDRLQSTFPELGRPELWINPNIESSILEAEFPFPYLRLEEELYNFTPTNFSWDGLERPSFKAKASRLISRLFELFGFRVPA